MKSNKRVLTFLELTYSKIIKSPLSFDFSIQATMNKVLKDNRCKSLNIERISDEVFVDGNTFLKKVTYIEDMKQYGYLGFHYDFIYGVKAKLFRIKELNLYFLEENDYFSLSNKYIALGYDLQTNIQYNLNKFLCIAKRTKRIAILPKIRNSKSNLVYISYILKINIQALEYRYGKNYRVSSFLNNSIMKNNIRHISKIYINNVSDIYNLMRQNINLIFLSLSAFTNIICSDGNYTILDNQWQRNK